MSRMLARKGLVAAAAALGLLSFAAAAPASADPTTSVTGTINVGNEVFEVDEEGDGPCEGSTAVDVEFTGSATSGTWTASGNIKAPFQVSSSTNWYQAEITLSDNGDGTYLPFGGSVVAQMELQQLDPVTCAKTALCNAVTLLVVDSSSSVTGGTLPNPTSVNLIADSSNGGVPMQLLGNCGVTLASALGGQDVFADLSLVF